MAMMKPKRLVLITLPSRSGIVKFEVKVLR